MATTSLSQRYTDYYRATAKSRKNSDLWPTEFLVRALLSSALSDRFEDNYTNVLDIGFGDGRNLPLLSSLFRNVYGIEISEEMCDLAKPYFPKALLRSAFSHDTKMPSAYFNHLVSVHALYYCQEASFDEIIEECRRVLASNGRIIYSIPTPSSYLLNQAAKLTADYAVVSSDPLGIRNGIRIKYFTTKEKLVEVMTSAGFGNVSVGLVNADWWGINEHYWIVSARAC